MNSQFELIVSTILSSQEVQPHIVRWHIEQYALDNGLTYEFAKQAIFIIVNYRLKQKLLEIEGNQIP